MKKWLIFGLLVAGCAFCGWWFWSLGDVPLEPAEQLALIPTQGIVEIRHRGSSGWESVRRETGVISGDTVRTGDDGTATIRVYGIGESRLGKGSELTITSASGTIDVAQPVVVRFRLSAGRVWTRLLRLLDIESAFSIEANQVAATVRGTSFDLLATATGTIIWVSDAGVDIRAERARVVNEGSMAAFDVNGRLLETRPLNEADQAGAWFQKNEQSDSAFLARALQEQQARFLAMGGGEPGSFVDGVARLSERLHLNNAGEQAPSLYARYISRRLFRITHLVEAGKSGLAFQALSQLEDELEARLKGNDGARYRTALRHRLTDIIRLFEGVDPSSPSYRLKQRIEDLQTIVNDEATDEAKFLYVRLLTIESSLMAADRLLDQGVTTAIAELLDAAARGMENVGHDIEKIFATASASDIDTLRGKRSALTAREAGLRERLAAAHAPPGIATTTTALLESIESTSTAASSTVVTTTQPALLQSIFLTAQPNPVSVGATARLSVSGLRTDGAQLDLTATARFELIGALGSLNGPTYSSPAAGSVSIRATVVDQGKTLTSTTGIEILQPAKSAVRLDLIPLGQTTLPPGGQLPLRAVVTYSDGSTKDVTDATTYAVSDAKLGTMAGNVFVATAEQIVGSLRITARYLEATATVLGALDVSIR